MAKKKKADVPSTLHIVNHDKKTIKTITKQAVVDDDDMTEDVEMLLQHVKKKINFFWFLYFPPLLSVCLSVSFLL